MKTSLIVVMGDVHNQIALAMKGLQRIESEFNRPIDQVFSVGDLGLFLDESDWGYLTGPKKYRTPEESTALRKTWAKWHWPLSAIGGNHEPLNRYRNWDPEAFSSRLQYTHAGELFHAVPQMKVAGLSGIYDPEHLEFLTPAEVRTRKFPEVTSWPEMLQLFETHSISLNRLTYYKEFEVESLMLLDFTPQLLLMHDWPVAPENLSHQYPRRPEGEIVEWLTPRYVCCGHQHTPADLMVGNTRVLALNIIARKEMIQRNQINPGWCAIFEWDGTALNFLKHWPDV